MKKFYLIPLLSKVTLLHLLLLSHVQDVDAHIGVNYGTMANNLPQPFQVANFLQKNTVIDRVRLFDTDPKKLEAFSNTGIRITVTISNEQIPFLTSTDFSRAWLEDNIIPHLHATNIVRILVGNEVLSTADKLLITSLVPAMQSLHTALVNISLDQTIKISTPLSLSMLTNSSPPSQGKFKQGYDVYILKPLLSFLKDTNSPFMINPYPFFSISEDTLDYALFRPNQGVFDENTNLTYYNMLDGQLDAVFSAIKQLGYADIDIVIAETGWPSKGDSGQFGVDVRTAAEYNGKVMQHVTSRVGTPLMPNRTFETYIFALFNEDLKPGPTCERNFGLFEPDLTPVYDVGIINNKPKEANAVQLQPSKNVVICLMMMMIILVHFLLWPLG